jgi:hypothetical protein
VDLHTGRLVSNFFPTRTQRKPHEAISRLVLFKTTEISAHCRTKNGTSSIVCLITVAFRPQASVSLLRRLLARVVGSGSQPRQERLDPRCRLPSASPRRRVVQAVREILVCGSGTSTAAASFGSPEWGCGTLGSTRSRQPPARVYLGARCAMRRRTARRPGKHPPPPLTPTFAATHRPPAMPPQQAGWSSSEQFLCTRGSGHRNSPRLTAFPSGLANRLLAAHIAANVNRYRRARLH